MSGHGEANGGDRPGVDLLIPANNEAETLPGVLAGALPLVERVLVVDDGSDDGTADVARSAGVDVLRLEKRSGKGAALRAGLNALLPEAGGYILFMDADAQHDPGDIPVMLAALGRRPRPDVVLGCRLRPETKDSIPRVRYATNLFGVYVLSRVTGLEVGDSQTGFRLIRADRLKEIELESTGFEIETEILIKLASRKITLVNVPVSITYHPGRSHYRSVPDTYRVCMATLRY
jgi:glycosyltransferase involved in cell wall biosynthesis